LYNNIKKREGFERADRQHKRKTE